MAMTSLKEVNFKPQYVKDPKTKDSNPITVLFALLNAKKGVNNAQVDGRLTIGSLSKATGLSKSDASSAVSILRKNGYPIIVENWHTINATYRVIPEEGYAYYLKKSKVPKKKKTAVKKVAAHNSTVSDLENKVQELERENVQLKKRLAEMCGKYSETLKDLVVYLNDEIETLNKKE